jgi:hypothetical protein
VITSGIQVTRGASPFRQTNDSEELRRATSPPNARAQRPGPNGPSPPAAVIGKQRRPYGRDGDGEGSTESVIRDRALSPDQARARSPPSRTASPAGPVSIESLVKTVQPQRSESPLVERERGRSPDPPDHGSQQPNIASVNGFAHGHGTKPGSTGNVTADLIRDLKARESELETLRRREAWMTAALARASRAGFVYANGDGDQGPTEEQPKVAEAVFTLKQLHGRIQVRHLDTSSLCPGAEVCESSHRRALPSRRTTRRCESVKPNGSGVVRSRRLRTTVRSLQHLRRHPRGKLCG